MEIGLLIGALLVVLVSVLLWLMADNEPPDRM